MSDDPIDAATFAELQDTAGAEFVSELVDTFLEEAPQMLAELRAAHGRRRRPNASAAQRIRSSPTPTPSARCAWASMARVLELGGLVADAAPVDALQAELRAGRRRAEGAGPWLMCPKASTAGARLLVADDNKVNRLLLGAQPGAAGPPRGQRRERPRRAGDAAGASTSTCCCWTWKCPRWTASRCWSSMVADAAVARPAGHRHQLARRRGACGALHRARRRRLPAQAGEPGAAEGAHRFQPGEEAPARPAEGTGAPLRHQRGGAGPAAIGLRAGRQAAHGDGDVLRHPRFHHAGRTADARRDHRAAEHLVHADVRRHHRGVAASSTR